MTVPQLSLGPVSFVVLLLICTAAVLPSNVAAADAANDKYWVYVGTYTGGKGTSEGIYRFEFDAATGKLTSKALAGKTKSPSFLTIHPNHRFLYAVGEG